MLTSIVVCHHKGGLVYKAVDSLLAQSKVKVDIIVMSSVLTQWPYRSHVRVFNMPGQPAAKRNVGARFAHGDYVAFFDDDIEADPDAVWEMYRVLKHQYTGMVFGKLLNMEYRDRFDEAGGFLTPTGFIWSRAESGIKDTGQYEKTERIFAGKSAACMVRKKLLKQVGGFDVKMGILGEESDLAWRVWLAGHKVMYCPRSITFHAFNTKYKPATFYTLERVYYNGARNYITMLFACLEWANVVRVLPVHVIAWLIASVGMIVTGKRHAGIHILKGLAYCIRNFNGVLRSKRLLTQRLRKIKDRDLFPSIMKYPSFGYYWHRFTRYLKIGLHG